MQVSASPISQINGFLYEDRWLCAPKRQIRLKILQDHQYHPVSGHISFKKTYKNIRRLYHWKSLRQTTKKYVDSCLKYQTKLWTAKTQGPTTTTASAEKEVGKNYNRFHHTPPQNEKNESSALYVIVDRLSKLKIILPPTSVLLQFRLQKSILDTYIDIIAFPVLLSPIGTRLLWTPFGKNCSTSFVLR